MLLQELHQVSLQEEELTRGPEMHLLEKGITSFRGMQIPQIIEGVFDCAGNQLTSLEYGPIEVESMFDCSGNQLTSLRYGPVKVEGMYSCSHNKLSSLQYCPTEIGKGFYCRENNLLNLEHCPTKVGGNFFCDANQLTSLQGIHKLFKGGYIKGSMALDKNPITSHILGLLLIPELIKVNYIKGDAKCIEAIKIINNHLEGDRDVVDCQQELIEAGFKAYAQL